MVTEVINTGAFPYSAIVSIRATYANGKVSLGTGTLVGKNDVLTATHVVYQPDFGGYATSIQVFPGADYNGTRGTMESAPFGSYFSGAMVGFPEGAFSDRNNATTSLFEVPSDIAVIGLTQAVGFQTGWFGMRPGNNVRQWATEIGYPGNGTGMMMSNHITNSVDGLWISASDPAGTALLGPGSSGGPLFIQEGLLPSIIGVKSSGNNTINYWADIDYKYDALIAAINDNDSLVGGSVFLSGSEARDTFSGSQVNQVINGLSGIDTISYAASSAQYKVFTTGNKQTNVVDVSLPNRGDTLINIERIKFSDKSIALDVQIGENAGMAYRMYKAALNREPDLKGLGDWVRVLDKGGNQFTDLARGFTQSDEFKKIYGTNLSSEAFITLLYKNALGRNPDQQGLGDWVAAIEQRGATREHVLHGFSESSENVTYSLEKIGQGMEYFG